MGQAKKYDRTELLDQAIEVFRLQGFQGTSTKELTLKLSVNPKSMYAEFGSKQGLFEAALERYNDMHLTKVLAPIEGPDAGTNGIRQSFASYAAAADGWARGRGCLMCNTAVERAALDPASGCFVDAYLERLTRAFHHSLCNAVEAGEIDKHTDLDRLAAFFTTALIGVAACIRAKAPPTQVRAACDVVTDILDAHRPTNASTWARASR